MDAHCQTEVHVQIVYFNIKYFNNVKVHKDEKYVFVKLKVLGFF